jgi:hypothetical protein
MQYPSMSIGKLSTISRSGAEHGTSDCAPHAEAGLGGNLGLVMLTT